VLAKKQAKAHEITFIQKGIFIFQIQHYFKFLEKYE